MNSLNYSLRDIQILKFIHKNDSCTVEMIKEKFDNSSLHSLDHLIKKELISVRNNNQVVIHLSGIELLKDNELLTRNKNIGKLMTAAVEICAALIGVVIGYFLGT